MRSIRRFVLAAMVMTTAACEGEPAVPAVSFQMFSAGSYDPTPFEQAWTAARADPALGVAYTFPLVTTDVEPGTEVRLVFGRSSNPPGYPLTTADDVIIADELVVATRAVSDDGAVEFAPLAVTTAGVTSGTSTIPAELLCGTTVIAARAFARGDGAVPTYRFVASTFMVAVAPACE